MIKQIEMLDVKPYYSWWLREYGEIHSSIEEKTRRKYILFGPKSIVYRYRITISTVYSKGYGVFKECMYGSWGSYESAIAQCESQLTNLLKNQ